MLILRKVAITGGPASGKSTVCRFLKELGAYVVSADEIVHQLLSQDQNTRQKIIELVGEEVLTGNCIDRQKIANKVFNDPEKLEALENFLHPKVREQVNRIYSQMKHKQPAPALFAAEIPLLFESGMDEDFDIAIAVISPQEVRRKRFAQKGLPENDPETDFNRRTKRFFSEEKLREKADYVIENIGTIEDLQQVTINLFPHICT